MRNNQTWPLYCWLLFLKLQGKTSLLGLASVNLTCNDIGGWLRPLTTSSLLP